MKILCIGDLNADLLLPYAEAKKKINNKNMDTSSPSKVIFQGGGSVANTCRVLGKLKEKPYFVTDLCKDSIGTFLETEMEQYGVDMSYSKMGENSPIVCVAVIEDDGNRVIFPWLPPHADLPHFKKESFSNIPLEDYIVFTGGMVLNNDTETMQSIYDFISNLKEETNSKFIFDLNMRKETYGLSEERKHYYDLYSSLADVILGSGEDEYCPLTSLNDMKEAIHSFRSNQVVIARDGDKPIHIVYEGKETIIECNKVNVIHTIGAGDTFDGAFIHAYNQNKSLEECVSYASYVASYMISHSGYLALPDKL